MSAENVILEIGVLETQKAEKETSETLVKLINQVSIETCIHGADTGGSYSQNKEGLVKALEDIKAHYGLVEYDIGEICNDEGWHSYGFIKRNG